jgi:hypothetical protein
VLTQFVSPDDQHDELETCRVKNKNKHIVKNRASRWSFTMNHNMMHAQQNVKNLHKLHKGSPKAMLSLLFTFQFNEDNANPTNLQVFIF